MRPFISPRRGKGVITLLALYICLGLAFARPSDVVITSDQIKSPNPTAEPFKAPAVLVAPKEDGNRTADKITASDKRLAESLPKSTSDSAEPTSAPRVIKLATPIIRNSIQMVASQLLHSTTISTPSPSAPDIVEDVRTPPKMKNQLTNKNKTKKPEIRDELIENSHAGIAVPISLDEVINEIHHKNTSSSTSKEGLSTWILLSNPTTTSALPAQNKIIQEKPLKDKNVTNDTIEPIDSKKHSQTKPTGHSKNKNQKKPSNVTQRPTPARRPIITGVNKSDLVASGSAMNENTLNTIKATVYANVQKNKNASKNKTTSLVSTTTVFDSNMVPEVTPGSIDPPNKKDNINKESSTRKAIVTTTTEKTEENTISLSAEAKESEIELEVSVPPSSTKKPKRTSGKRKKNKNKHRRPASTTSTTIEPETTNTKISNTKISKPSLKEKPITTQIYNYLSREIMPSVGVGIVGLAGLVGLASYFLYPFTGPVRRNYDINDRKDDIYRHNGEEYANDGNGQAEEEMLGTVLAGIPANSNKKVNPYVAQTSHYQQTKYSQNRKTPEQNIRYRNVGYNSEINNYSPNYVQQKSEISNGIIYPENIHYNTHKDDNQQRFSTYQTSDSVQTVFGTSVNQDAHGNYDIDPFIPQNEVNPTYDTSFSYDNTNIDTTRSPVSTSVHLGTEDMVEHQQETGYFIADSNSDEHPQFIVGNIPKEIIEVVTPAAVPEHGPRKLRIRRSIMEPSEKNEKRGVSDRLEEILKNAKENNIDDFSNEIDEPYTLSNAIYEDDVNSLSVISLTPQKKKDDFENQTIEKHNIFLVKPEYATSDLPSNFRTTLNDNPSLFVSNVKYNEAEKENPILFKEITPDVVTIMGDLSTNTMIGEDINGSDGQNTILKYTTESVLSIKDNASEIISFEKASETSINSQNTDTETTEENKISTTWRSLNPSVKDLGVMSLSEIENYLTSKRASYVTDSTSDIFISTTTSEPVISEFIKSTNDDGEVRMTNQFTLEGLTTTKENIQSNEIDVEFNDLSTNKINANNEVTFLMEVTTSASVNDTEATIFITSERSNEIPTSRPNNEYETLTISPLYSDSDIPDRYPQDPPKTFSFLSLLKRLFEFKYRLGLSILQSTSETLARYFKGAEHTFSAVAKASHYAQPQQ